MFRGRLQTRHLFHICAVLKPLNRLITDIISKCHPLCQQMHGGRVGGSRGWRENSALSLLFVWKSTLKGIVHHLNHSHHATVVTFSEPTQPKRIPSIVHLQQPRTCVASSMGQDSAVQFDSPISCILTWMCSRPGGHRGFRTLG